MNGNLDRNVTTKPVKDYMHMFCSSSDGMKTAKQ